MLQIEQLLNKSVFRRKKMQNLSTAMKTTNKYLNRLLHPRCIPVGRYTWNFRKCCRRLHVCDNHHYSLRTRRYLFAYALTLTKPAHIIAWYEQLECAYLGSLLHSLFLIHALSSWIYMYKKVITQLKHANKIPLHSLYELQRTQHSTTFHAYRHNMITSR